MGVNEFVKEVINDAAAADAEVMAAMGYSQKDVLRAEVQKEYAKGIGQMGSTGTCSCADSAGRRWLALCLRQFG